MRDNNKGKGGMSPEDKVAMNNARRAEEAIMAAEQDTTTMIRRKNGRKTVTRRKLEATDKKKPNGKRGAYRVTLKEISKSEEGYVNDMHTKGKPGIETSMSAHVAFEHNRRGKTFPVVIPKATIGKMQQASKELPREEVGSWVRENVEDWKDKTWYFTRIGHTNVISDKPLDRKEDISGYVLISSKRVEQNTRKGKNTYYFPHIIILSAEEKRIKPVFWLVINNYEGQDVPGQVHIGPTVNALQGNKLVEEYLHLKPCK